MVERGRSPVERAIADWGRDPESAALAWLVRTGELVTETKPQHITLIIGKDAVLAADVIATLAPEAAVHLLALKPLKGEGPRCSNVEVTVCQTLPERFTEISVRPRPDLIVERGNHRKGQKHFCLRNLSPLLRDGGRYVVEALDTVGNPKFDDHPGPDVVTVLAAVRERLGKVAGPDPDTGEFADPDDALAFIWSAVEMDEHRAIVVKSGEERVKLRDSNATEVLTKAGLAPRIRAEWELEEFVPRNTARSFGPGELVTAESVEVKPRTLREYRGVRVESHQRVSLGSWQLPDTFRHPYQGKLTHTRLMNIDRGTARDLVPASSSRQLSGRFFYFDTEYPGHFGHVMTEVLSRVPGWCAAREHCPELRPLVSVAAGQDDIPQFQRDVFAAAGVDLDGIEFVREGESVEVESLFAVTPDLAMPGYVAPRLADVWAGVGDTLVASRVSQEPTPARVFVTRPASGYRVCHDLVAVEAFFAAEGFTIIRPETMPLAEQVALFRGADIIAGFAGSGMFNAMFVDAPRLLLISGSSYTANNEYLIGAVVGGSLDVFWGDSDITQPEDGWTWDAFFSPFSFDVAQHAAELRHVING